MTFVTATLHNPASVTRHARVKNRLDGPVLPPLEQGIPEQGWDEDGVTVTVPAETTVGIGYACRAPPDPSASSVELDATGRGTAPEDAPERRARRSLETFRPPREAVQGESAVIEDETRRQPPRNRRCSPRDRRQTDDRRGRQRADDAGSEKPAVTRAKRRIELGDRLAECGVDGAADALERLGDSDLVRERGIDGAVNLRGRLGEDAETLDREADRLRSEAKRLREAADQAEEEATQLSSRAERARSIEVPVDALGRFERR